METFNKYEGGMYVMHYRQQVGTSFIPIPGAGGIGIGFPGGPGGGPGFPGGPGGGPGGGFTEVNRRLNRLERQYEQLERQVNNLQRRVTRIERQLGFGPTPY